MPTLVLVSQFARFTHKMHVICSTILDGLHLSGKGAVVFAEGLTGVVACGMGKVRYLI